MVQWSLELEQAISGWQDPEKGGNYANLKTMLDFYGENREALLSANGLEVEGTYITQIIAENENKLTHESFIGNFLQSRIPLSKSRIVDNKIVYPDDAEIRNLYASLTDPKDQANFLALYKDSLINYGVVQLIKAEKFPDYDPDKPGNALSNFLIDKDTPVEFKRVFLEGLIAGAEAREDWGSLNAEAKSKVIESYKNKLTALEPTPEPKPELPTRFAAFQPGAIFEYPDADNAEGDGSGKKYGIVIGHVFENGKFTGLKVALHQAGEKEDDEATTEIKTFSVADITTNKLNVVPNDHAPDDVVELLRKAAPKIDAPEHKPNQAITAIGGGNRLNPTIYRTKGDEIQPYDEWLWIATQTHFVECKKRNDTNIPSSSVYSLSLQTNKPEDAERVAVDTLKTILPQNSQANETDEAYEARLKQLLYSKEFNVYQDPASNKYILCAVDYSLDAEIQKKLQDAGFEPDDLLNRRLRGWFSKYGAIAAGAVNHFDFKKLNDDPVREWDKLPALEEVFITPTGKPINLFDAIESVDFDWKKLQLTIGLNRPGVDGAQKSTLTVTENNWGVSHGTDDDIAAMVTFAKAAQFEYYTLTAENDEKLLKTAAAFMCNGLELHPETKKEVLAALKTGGRDFRGNFAEAQSFLTTPQAAPTVTRIDLGGGG